jgi:tripartite-type tricarboxylate transporter receptor subunit TctC
VPVTTLDDAVWPHSGADLMQPHVRSRRKQTIVSWSASQRRRGGWRSAVMRRLLIRIGDFDELWFVPRASEELHTDRQSIGCEPARNADGRQAGVGGKAAVVCTGLRFAYEACLATDRRVRNEINTTVRHCFEDGLPQHVTFYNVLNKAALRAVSQAARAQTYPSRPVRWIVPYPPGGAGDILARLMAQQLSDRLGQPFVIENKPGAGTNIGTESVVRAPADGYTLLLAATPAAINATLYEKLNFNFIRDITPIASLIGVPEVLVVNPSFSAKTVTEFIAYAKAHPGKINYASSGNGTFQHLCGELFKMMTGIDMVHVPYRGDAFALNDLIGGQVQAMFGNTAPSIEHIRTDKLRALAVTTMARLDVLRRQGGKAGQARRSGQRCAWRRDEFRAYGPDRDEPDRSRGDVGHGDGGHGRVPPGHGRHAAQMAQFGQRR